MSLCDALSGGVSGPDGGQHHPVKCSWSQVVEADPGCVRFQTLVLDDTAVVDQQDAVRVHVTGCWLPLGLQAVGAAAV